MKNPHSKIILLTVMITLGMFLFSFATSPLYSKLCNSVDFYSGKKLPATGLPDFQRTIKIEFVTTKNQNLPWDFYPKTSSITIHPNENQTVYFYAKNNTSSRMIVQAIPSFTPKLAAGHFHKTECFCFTQQILAAGQSITMPVVFHVDEDLPNTISVITLAYTLFDLTHKRVLKE